jgi:hypothetical protein
MFQFSKTRRQPRNYVNDASKENKVEIITVTQNCVMIFETNPVLIAIGKNTTTITKVMEVTVPPISAVPSYAARTLFFPFPCACRYSLIPQWHHQQEYPNQ